MVGRCDDTARWVGLRGERWDLIGWTIHRYRPLGGASGKGQDLIGWHEVKIRLWAELKKRNGISLAGRCDDTDRWVGLQGNGGISLVGRYGGTTPWAGLQAKGGNSLVERRGGLALRGTEETGWDLIGWEV